VLWLVWRQHRTQMLVISVLLVAFGAVLLVHGLRTADLISGLAPGSLELEKVLSDRLDVLNPFLTWLPLVPGLIGLFLGAPLLTREVEAGTAKLAWTQSVSPRRWMTTKLAALGLVVTLLGLGLGLMINTWLATFGDAGYRDRFSLLHYFGGTGVASAAWWLFSFMLGVTAGTVWRRTLPAMALGFAGYVVAFMVVASPLVDFRDLYAEPTRAVLTGQFENPPEGSWKLDSRWLDAEGRTVSVDSYLLAKSAGCEDKGPRIDYTPCLFDNGYQQAIEYFPPSMYWRFQWTEAAILVAAAAAAGGGVIWSVRRRV
jgi:hypothetical protein